MKRPAILYLAILTIFLISCTEKPDTFLDTGVSDQLANYRKTSLSEILYTLSFDIPAETDKEIEGNILIEFNLTDTSMPLVIDFNAPAENVVTVVKNEQDINFSFTNKHIVIPEKHLSKGKNSFEIEFIAGESSLNRNKEFLYSLFVPDRASFSFPCFDQPNLKATFKLSLNIPEDWQAISNSSAINVKVIDNYKHYDFSKTDLLSTYLFSFAAGKFEVIEKEHCGYAMRMFHRETDEIKLKNNCEEIFRLHAEALKWLEEYTDIKYPFEKFDFVVIPSFQYSGMEHPGAILYRDSKLFLEETPTTNDLLTRASLISHETAHIWFGDFVTMEWFDDVWLKEVFANFMAAKIANPTFPDVNHTLRFLMAHFPGAYSVDRTPGANPIKQDLENLRFAGTLYGDIIYKKSPIVMQQLENIIGKEKFQTGIKKYLNEFKYGNADWIDLISILDELTDENLEQWSDVWINQPGRPEISYEMNLKENKITEFIISQNDKSGDDKIWNQPLQVIYFRNGIIETFDVYLNDDEITLPELIGKDEPDFILLNGSGLEYGNFVLDNNSIRNCLKNVSEIEDPAIRGCIWLTLYDNLLEEKIDPLIFTEYSLKAIKKENNQQILNQLINQLKVAHWNLMDLNDQDSLSVIIETEFIELLNSDKSAAFKSIYFNGYKDLASSNEAVNNLYKLWSGELSFNNLSLSEKDKINLSYELAVRNHHNANDILAYQLKAIKNKDVRDKYMFVMDFASPSDKTRDEMFVSLKNFERRSHEPWVIDALKYLHHPYRRDYSVKYLKESLELVEEIQKTGDIFFPKRWLDATFSYHNSNEAVKIVKEFFKNHPNYNERLKNKILQSTYMLFRTTTN